MKNEDPAYPESITLRAKNGACSVEMKTNVWFALNQLAGALYVLDLPNWDGRSGVEWTPDNLINIAKSIDLSMEYLNDLAMLARNGGAIVEEKQNKKAQKE